LLGGVFATGGGGGGRVGAGRFIKRGVEGLAGSDGFAVLKYENGNDKSH
jgi:hypothetical protein